MLQLHFMVSRYLPINFGKKINMTDAATKNLLIENQIASELNSHYKPIHLLCNSHTVEALDRSNMGVQICG